MLFFKVLNFAPVVFGTLVVPDRVNDWAYNPKCPTEEAKQNCDKSCMDINVVCTIACGGNYDCISNCTRAYYTCIEDCPCNKNCFQGCPCPEENEFCIPEVELECDEEFDFEFNQCHDEMQQDMFECVSACDNHDHDCEITCFSKFETDLENCPCMSKCEEGCPCPFFDCPENPNPNPTNPAMPEYYPGVISTNKTQLNGSCYDNHWVENKNPIKYSDCNHGLITHYNYAKDYSSMTPKYCIEKCEGRGIYEYAVLSKGNQCWCGNQPPYNETLYECRIPCTGDYNQYCGGRNRFASFYSITAKNGDGCIYRRQNSADGSHEINIVETENSYRSYQQSWFTFECPMHYSIMYYFEYFDLYYYSSDPNRDSHLYMAFEGQNGTQTTSFHGYSPCETCPHLYDWQTTDVNSIEFQFRAGSSTSKGFRMALKCKKNST